MLPFDGRLLHIQHNVADLKLHLSDDPDLEISEPLLGYNYLVKSEAPLLSVLLIGIPQCRDIVTVLLLLSYCYHAIIYDAG